MNKHRLRREILQNENRPVIQCAWPEQKEILPEPFKREGKTLIAMPTSRYVLNPVVKSLVELIKFSPATVDFEIMESSNISLGRNNLVKYMLSNPAYHGICFIDSDQTFPPDALEAILTEQKDIIGYVIKSRQSDSINVGSLYDDYIHRQLAWREYPRDCIFEVGWIGNGFIYISRKAFEAIGFPYFLTHYKGDNNEYIICSDFDFSIKAKQAGITVWASSKRKIGHLGTVELV
jgi:hypothetical protein